MTPTEQQQLGALVADVANLKDDMAEAKDDRKAMRADVLAIRETLAEARGYWKMGLMIAGLAGAVGALIAKVVAWLPILPKQ